MPRIRTRGSIPTTTVYAKIAAKAKRTSSVPYTPGYSAIVAQQSLPGDGSELSWDVSQALVNLPQGTPLAYETITDDIGGTPGFKLRSVSHTKRYATAPNSPIKLMCSSSGTYGATGTAEGFFGLTHAQLLALTSNATQTFSTNDKNSVKTRVGNGEFDHANLGEFFAELHMAKQLVTGMTGDLLKAVSNGSLAVESILRGIRGLSLGVKYPKAINQMTIGQLKSGAKQIREGAYHGNNIYLAYIFGVAPMLKDIQKLATVMSALERHRKNVAEHPLIAKFQSSMTKDIRETVNGTYAQNMGYCMSRFSYERTGKTVYTVSAYYKYNPENLNRVSDARRIFDGLGGRTPFGTVWNLVPWSFVIDWFYDIGSYLDQFKVSAGDATLLGACESTRTEINATGSVEIHPTGGGFTCQSGSSLLSTGYGVARGVGILRQYGRSPISLTASPPGLELPDWRQLRTLASLAFQKFGRASVKQA